MGRASSSIAIAAASILLLPSIAPAGASARPVAASGASAGPNAVAGARASAGPTAVAGARASAGPNAVAGASVTAARGTTAAGACRGESRRSAPIRAQMHAMRCLVDRARGRAGLPPLADSAELDGSAWLKAGDVLRCDEFSHFACGRRFTHWIRASGYMSGSCWRIGENLAWGTGSLATPRSIFLAWMRSAGHRMNILGDFDELGLSVRRGRLEGHRGARVWVQHFGSRCD